MTVRPLTPAEHTAAILQEAAQGGTPVMIPGAFEPRIVHPDVRLANVTAVSLTSDVPDAVMDDRQRLEYEREGGGAASQRRTPGRRQTPLARLWHWAAHLAADPIA